MKMFGRSGLGVFGLVGVAALMATGCPSDLEDPAGDGSDSANTSTGSDPDTEGMTSQAMTTASTMGATTGAVDSTGGGMDTAGFITASSGGGGDPLPNGGQCSGNDSCESGFCYQVPMVGGVCSECLMDADCEMGTCALDIGLLYAVCTDGGLGKMCDSDEGCMGDLTCETVINTGGIFDINTCSECSTTADCAMNQVCNPSYDVATISGYLSCVDEGSVPNGEGCPWDMGTMMGDGTPCMSGICSGADILGFLTLGVCGECASDADCPGMGTCQAAVADMTGIMPSTCI